MLEILRIQDKEEQEKICGLCGIMYDVETLSYAAYVSGVLTGAVQFAIHGDSGYIYEIRNAEGIDDGDALFIMGRAVLNFIELCGIKRAYSAEVNADEKLMNRIGLFRDDSGIFNVNLEGFFDSPCEIKGT